MDTETLKVPKKLQPVTLWVHPEGRVTGGIYLREHSPNHAGSEYPLEVLNQGDFFLVFKRDNPDEIRFYNLRSVIRVEYEHKDIPAGGEITVLHCHLQMMDGSLIEGTIQETLPADRSRLLDYLNKKDDGFIKVHMEDKLVYLINKAYIIHVHVAEMHGADSDSV